MNSKNISQPALEIITGQLPQNFGEPLKEALRYTFSGAGEESLCATAIIGMLYLSHRMVKFPQTKLRTYCCNLREEISPLPLDCRHYEDICAAIEGGTPTAATLINEELMPQKIVIEKVHILEALDFISNG